MVEKRTDGGFAHLVVLAVVGVVGTLGVLTVAGVERYRTHAKTAEATRNLGAIETGEKMAYQMETDQSGSGIGPYVHKFCENAGPTPKIIPAGTQVAVKSTDWSAPGWFCLRFSINVPFRYQYATVENGKIGADATYTATARGDLDGDGTTSTFELTGRGTTTGDAERVTFRVQDEDE
jgi:hypothetical protein